MSVAVVRPAAPEDASRMAALMREFYQHERLQYGPSVAVALGSLLTDGSQGRAWLFEAEDEDAGYLILTWGYSLEFGGRYGLVDELYVRSGYRGQGLGTRALQAAVVACEAHGARAVRLEVDHANPAAARLYERVGFVVHTRNLMTYRLNG
jgi:ribosomal protein S18 acetylase RimI-like enzyme